MSNFPGSLDDAVSLPNPAAADKQNNPSHSNLHSITNEAVKAVEAKVGIGATTPAVNKMLLGTGTGTTAWQQLTSAELRGVLSDETGTGLAVFATTPTLTTPKVNTINEETAANGVTVDSLNIKDGKLNTNDSVVTANITNKAVTEEKISDGWVHGSDGWIDSTQTWTYVSATSFKITGTDVTAQFPVGTKLKLTQTTAKYFYVTAATFSTDTTVTVTGGSDYTLANAAITSPMYSYMESPQGHPGWFAYTPTVTAASGSFTTTSATGRFSMNGRLVTITPIITITTVGTGTGCLFTVPVTAKASGYYAVSGRDDAVSGKQLQGRLTSTTQISMANYDNTNPSASGAVFRIAGQYEAA